MLRSMLGLTLLGVVVEAAGLHAQVRATHASHPRVTYNLPHPEPVSAGAPTPDSLAHLVVNRFASDAPEAFDSIFPDPLGRAVVETAIRRKQTRKAGLHRVLWTDRDRAVLLITGVVHAGHGTGISTGSDETNLVRRFSGLYEAVRRDGSWVLTRQIPFDTANYIRAQILHVALVPGKKSRIVDTLTLTIGSPYGFAARLNAATQFHTVQLDGRRADYEFGGGVLWIKTPRHAHAQLALDYAIADEHEPPKPSAAVTGAASATPADTAPAYGALNNTDAWHPFFNYDSGHDLSPLSVTVSLPAEYRLTTSLPQTETVRDGVRIVHGKSMHPQFLLSLIYDRDWLPETTMIGKLRFETFLTPDFHFSHDTLAKIVAREYRLLVPRFGMPQAPSNYLAIVEERALGHTGFTVRMNNAVVSGDRAVMLDEPVLGPSFAFAHEVAHGWTMDATGPAANFLQEGWATYCESLMLRDVYGPDAEHAFWEKVRTSYAGGLDRSGFLGGFEGKQSILGNPDNGRIHYFKGSWVFHSLEYALGETTFDRGMREYIARSGTGPDGYQEFIAAMSHAAGYDMTSFIMPWLSEKYIPDVEGHVAGNHLIVTQTQPSAPFDLPLLDVELITPSGPARRSMHLSSRADTVDLGNVGAVSAVRIDPDHHYLLRRHWGETIRFTLRAPEAKTVELSGNFLGKPIPATRNGDLWTVEMPLTEGRYLWLWVVDGKQPSDEAVIAAAKAHAGNAAAIGGVRIVKPLKRLPDADAR